jgi:hypothetical protein
MNTLPVSVGDRVFTRGDVCNQEGWATVEELRTTRWGTSILVQMDVRFEEPLRGDEVWIEMTAFTGTRKWTDRWQTKAEYAAYRQARIEGNL